METHNEITIGEVPARMRAALDALLLARHYANQTTGDCWEFAVELSYLTGLGLTYNDFRWLVRKQLVAHQREVTLEGDDGRAFRPTGDLTFPEGTCFVLTDIGVSALSGCGPIASLPVTTFTTEKDDAEILECRSQNGKSSHGEAKVPTWDAEMRELRVLGMTVKRFKWTAANQEPILAAFEEECWPRRIDDPLPPHPDQDSKRRLCDTIKCLNRKQINQLIHFRGDGTGEGITWELVEPNSSRETSRP